MDILIVEDDRDISDALDILFTLSTPKRSFKFVKTVEDAMDELIQIRYKLVLIDLMLGGKPRGLDLIQWCQERPELECPVIVVMTAVSHPQALLNMFEIKNTILLKKPFDIETLEEILNQNIK